MALAVAASAWASPAPAVAGSACDRWGHGLPAGLTTGQARKALTCIINRERKARGIAAMDRDGRLERAAQRHSRRMRGSGCFGHECPGEPDLEQRLRASGYIRDGLRLFRYDENISWGTRQSGTPSATVARWMASRRHRANILDRGLHDIGVGFVSGSPRDDDDAAGIYTVDFGLRVR